MQYFLYRSWDLNANIKVSMYCDKIEMFSRGGLPYGEGKEDYLSGKVSVLRNPCPAYVVQRLDMIEISGTGITRIRNAYKPFSVKPAFDISDNFVTVTLPVTKPVYQPAPEENKI